MALGRVSAGVLRVRPEGYFIADADCALTWKEAAFGTLFHLTKAGHAVVAKTIRRTLLEPLRARGSS